MKKKNAKATDDPPSKNALEWGVFAVSALLLLAVFAHLAWRVLSENGSPGRLVVTTGEPQSAADGWTRVPVTVTNEGDAAACGVRLQIKVAAGTSEQTGELEIDRVPARGERKGQVAFREFPANAVVTGGIVAHEEP